MRRIALVVAALAVGVAIVLWFTRKANATPSSVSPPPLAPRDWSGVEKYSNLRQLFPRDTGEVIEEVYPPAKVGTTLSDRTLPPHPLEPPPAVLTGVTTTPLKPVWSAAFGRLR